MRYSMAHSNSIADVEGLKEALESSGEEPTPPSWESIIDKPTVIAAGASQALARTAIGAGTSNLGIGTTASTAKAGNYTPTWGEVSSKPTSFTPSAHNQDISTINGLQAISTNLTNRIAALESPGS